MMGAMRGGNIRNIDLNLLKVLEELLRQRSVTRAAERLGLSQPAVSRSLGRLRQIFDDPLFVRSSGQIRPTPLALELQGRVANILDETRDLLRPRVFDPASESGTVRINAPDSATFVVMSKVFGRLGSIAPKVEFIVSNASQHRISALARSEIDLAIDLFEHLPAEFQRQHLIQDEFVVLARRDHPLVERDGQPDAFLRWSYVRLLTGAGRFVDDRLTHMNVHLHYALTLSNFVVAAAVVADSDWLWILTRNLARQLANMFPLNVLEMPFSIPDLRLDMVWHKRLESDPLHLWVRKTIIEATCVECPSDGSRPGTWCSSTEPSSRLRALNSAVADGMTAVAIDRFSGEARVCENQANQRTTNDRRDDEPPRGGGEDP
jgi:DNA-binding transcriptional LysR family regulator